MDLGLRDRVIFITGASRGIGAAVAGCLAAEGACLALTAHHNLAFLEQRVAAAGSPQRALALQVDVSRPEEVDAAMQQAREHFGRVDGCVANAGIWPPESRRLDEMPVDRIRETIETNLLGAVWTARAFMRELSRCGPHRDGGGASLTLIGSTAGRFGERGHSEYAVSKSGLYGLLRSLKNEIVAIDPYARVNLIEPGYTATPMARSTLGDPEAVRRIVRTMSLRQIASAEDIARAVVFLSSPVAARHVSGEVLTIAGGMEGRVQWEPERIDPEEILRRLD